MNYVHPGNSQARDAVESARPDSIAVPEIVIVHDVAGRGMRIVPQQIANSVKPVSPQPGDQPAAISQLDGPYKPRSTVPDDKRASTLEPGSHPLPSSAWSVDSQETWWDCISWWNCIKSGFTCCIRR